ncbi:Aminopeptidase N [Pontiella desulfatans]|uniref:Aminopeptidase n=1 Tax=Pontiella desulfatans TaxID=2750659 RepID=A0A6C2TZD3_PONDE|nr:M1 family metallopeptidase [Pontiella desulfatans]VGO12721.1 Aminopeptidase N [Pontiella desulfatans]
MTKILLTLALLIGLLGCKEEKDPLRLDHAVKPLMQKITLSLDPDQDWYRGTVEIRISVPAGTESFRFHARDLGIENVELHSGNWKSELSFSEGEKGTITATAPEPINPGYCSLQIGFTNVFSRQGTGIYKVEYEGRNYLFSQMEPEYARDSFPCWDAPEFKIPWELELRTPTNVAAYANTPVCSTFIAKGRKVTSFKESKPMPSYLVAFAVGDFEEVPIDDFPVEGKIIVPKGKTGLTAEAARISPPLLKALEAYFGIPYPYEKLDQIAVPEFNFGAMENVGLITYRDTALLRDPKAITLGQKQWLASIVAHEMAHMWFGNLVTPKWWDDLWLNESFASWIALKMVNETFPEYEMHNNDIRSRQRALDADSLSTTRPIRRPIAASDAMAHLFDSLAYNKGMAVLDMVESWMGEEPFRKGMAEYMNDHAWGNADAFDLAQSLGTVAGSDVLAIMKSFVTQPGIPFLEFEPLGTREIRISQQRYAHLGTTADETPEWIVPLALKFVDGTTQKVLLTQRSQSVLLDRAVQGFYPNADEKGYYRWTLPPEHMTQLSADVRQLDIRNRLGFISNLAALFSAGAIDAPAYLEILASFSTDESPEVRQTIVDNLTGFAGGLIPPDLEEAYGTFLSSVLKPMLAQIGSAKAEGEDPLIEQLRPGLIAGLGWHGDDAGILQLAKEMAMGYMADPYAVDPSLAKPFLRLAALAGDEALFNAYVEKFETVTEPTQKATYLKGLTGFRDPELMERALDYALSNAVPPHLFGTIPYGLTNTDANRWLVFEWLKENYPAIQAKVPEQSLSYLPWLACGQSPELLDDARSFLLVEGRKTQGMEIEFGKVEAVVKLNAALREKELEGIRGFLCK